MMLFRRVKESLRDTVIGPAAAGRFRMIGYQKQAKDASLVLGNNRLVQVYYKRGVFPKNTSRMTGPVQHQMTFQLDFTVSTGFLGDVSVLDDPESTPEQLSAALASFQEAADVADASMDELMDIIYQIVMDGRNNDLGLDKGDVTGRWLGDFEKDQPAREGEYVILTGSAQLSVSGGETVDGDIGVPSQSVSTSINIDGDDTAKTAVTVNQ